MQLSITLITVIVLVVAVWILMETRKFKHKIVEVFLIVFILFTYFSFTFVVGSKGLDLSTFNGIKEAGGIYLSWLGGVFSNLKTLTANAIHMNWGFGQALNSSVSNLTNATALG